MHAWGGLPTKKTRGVGWGGVDPHDPTLDLFLQQLDPYVFSGAAVTLRFQIQFLKPRSTSKKYVCSIKPMKNSQLYHVHVLLTHLRLGQYWFACYMA